MLVPGHLRTDFVKFAESLPLPVAAGDGYPNKAINGVAPPPPIKFDTTYTPKANGTFGARILGQSSVSSLIEDNMKLQDMGFTDVEQNFEVLRQASSFEGAVEKLREALKRNSQSSAKYADSLTD